MEKTKLLEEKNEQLKTCQAQMLEEQTKQRSDSEQQIRTLREAYEAEKEKLVQSFKETREANASDERLLASTLYEMGSFVNALVKEQHKTSGSRNPMAVYAELQHQAATGPTESFITAQTSARAQTRVVSKPGFGFGPGTTPSSVRPKKG